MRHLLWIAGATLMLTTGAWAQSDRGSVAGGYVATPAGAAANYQAAAPAPENCGTPDDFRACGPMPRRALKYYPGDRAE